MVLRFNAFQFHEIPRFYLDCLFYAYNITDLKGGGGGGGGEGVQAYHFGKNYFEVGVEREGQDTSRNFEGCFGSMRGGKPKSELNEI